MSDSEASAEFFQDDQIQQFTEKFTKLTDKEQKEALIKFAEQISDEELLLLAEIEPRPKSELLYAKVLSENATRLNSSIIFKLADVSSHFQNEAAKAFLFESLLQNYEEIGILKKYIKSSGLKSAEYVSSSLLTVNTQFRNLIYSNFAKALLSHFEFCTTAKGEPLWEQANKKDRQISLKMLFTDKIALVFAVLISNCQGNQILENTVFQLFTIYENEMIKHRANWPGLLFMINLMSMCFESYFSVQNILFELYRQSFKPLPEAAYLVNINQYKAKMFNEAGQIDFLRLAEHPDGLCDSNQWFISLRKEVVESLSIYLIEMCGLDSKDPNKLLNLPEVCSWLIVELSTLNEQLSGGKNGIVYGKVEQADRPEYEREVKRLKEALIEDRDSICQIRNQLSGKEIELLFETDALKNGTIIDEFEQFCSESRILALNKKELSIEHEKMVEVQKEPSLEQDSVQVEEDYEPEELSEKEDEIRDLIL